MVLFSYLNFISLVVLSHLFMPTFYFASVDAIGVEVASDCGRIASATGAIDAFPPRIILGSEAASPHATIDVVREGCVPSKRLREDYGVCVGSGCEAGAIGDSAIGAKVPVVPMGKLWRHDAAIRAMILQGMGYRGIADRLQAEHGLKVTVRAVQLYGRKLCHGDLFDGLKQERAASRSVVG